MPKTCANHAIENKEEWKGHEIANILLSHILPRGNANRAMLLVIIKVEKAKAFD